MAHFAKLNKDNIVEQVIVVNNDECVIDGVEQEIAGVNFCKSIFGDDTVWKQTSYNANIRKNFAGIGYYYNEQLDAFIPPKPFDSWTLTEQTCTWESPIPYPSDGKMYFWDESQLNWIESVMQ